MENYIQLKAIRDLMGVNYFIPSYQRGYRWNKSQVDDLLNDLYGFASKANKGEKEFYCLQPIVVRKINVSNLRLETLSVLNTVWDTFEVIDGQQRLTTIKILLKYLEEKLLRGDSFEDEYGFSVFHIVYETRTELFKIFDQLSQANEDNIDFSHITSAYSFIEEWFKKQDSPREAREGILRTLVNTFETKKAEGIVQVIWYELNENITNPVDIFLRINLGKIPLTNGELVKALFLQESNYGIGDLAELQQMEIAQEWDLMERSLQDDNFWWFISNSEFGGSTRIEFILNLLYQGDLKKDPNLTDITGNDNHQIFRYYNNLISKEKGFTGVAKIWDSIKKLFNQINEWYTSPEWFHYIGFLIYKGISVLDVLNWIEEKEKELNNKINKPQFTSLLVGKISTYFKDITLLPSLNFSNGNTLAEVDLIRDGYLNISYKNSRLVRDTLLLYNLQYIINQNKRNDLLYRFPFQSFKNVKDEDGNKTSWDIEHVDSSTEKVLDSSKDQKVWLTNALADLKNIHPELKDRISYFLTQEKTEDKEFEELYTAIRVEANEKEKEEDMKNNIGNLTLLDARTNRGYGNALFITKRRIVITKDKKGQFIPLLTKNVFLKYNNVHDVKTNWTLQDIESYNKDIKETILPFLKFK